MSSVFSGVARLLENISGKKSACPRETAAQERHARFLLHPDGLLTPDLPPSRVRLVVFKDERGVKTSLFDSQVHCDQKEGEEDCSYTRSLCDLRSHERLEKSTSSVPITVSAERWRGRQRPPLTRRTSSDSELLGEMMFGSMPMKTVGNTVKVHYIRSTDQLMLTKVFCLQRRTTMSSCPLMDFSDSCPLPGELSSHVLENSLGPIPKNHHLWNVSRPISPDTKHRSSSLNVPTSRPSSSLSFHRSSSPSPSSHSPSSSLSSLTVSSVHSSLSRRIQRSRSTSLENAAELYRKVLKPLDQPSRKGRKYGIGVIICLSELSKQQIRHFQEFFFSHVTLIDAHLEQLKEGVEEACHCKSAIPFMAGVTKAYQGFLKDFLALYKAPRIQHPAWLGLVSEEERRKALCMTFMEELASAIVEFDTKENRFFLSTLLTTVLSHHLAWVHTVSRSNRLSKNNSKSLAVLAASHPYNPLWAQLGDLYGAISFPLKITRTIVTGQHSATVMRLLYILTYFIRCSEIQPGVLLQQLNSFSPDPLGSHDGSHDWTQELEESDIFQDASRASSATVLCEHEHQSFTSPINIGGETPHVKPHPFSFRQTLSTSDYSRPNSQSEDSFDYHLHKSASSSDATCNTSIRSFRKANSLTKSSSLDSQSSSLKLSSPLVTSTANVARQPGAMTTGSHLPCGGTLTRTNAHHSSVFPSSSGNCIHPSSHKPRDKECACVTSEDHQHHQQPPRCDCHYKDSKESCATVASCESMGFCPLEDGYNKFDPSKHYSSNSPPPFRNYSTDSLNDFYHCCNEMSRNTSSNSLGSRSLGATNFSKSNSPVHQVCGSVDSGCYDQSLTISSLSDSTKESCITDSLLVSSTWKTGAIGLEASKHCDPEGSNVLFSLGNVRSLLQGKQEQEEEEKMISLELQVEEGEILLARPPSSYPFHNKAHFPSNHATTNTPTSQHKSGIDSDKEEEEDESFTPLQRRRSGAFSYPNRKSWTIEDVSSDTLATKQKPELGTVSEKRFRTSSPAISITEEETEANLRSGQRQVGFTAPIRETSPEASLPINFLRVPSRQPTPEPTNEIRLPSSWLLRDSESVMTDADSGHCTKSVRTDFEEEEEEELENTSQASLAGSINVEESLSPSSLSFLRSRPPSLLQEKLSAYEQSRLSGLPPSTLEQFEDFTRVELPSLDEFHLPSSETDHRDDSPQPPSTADFGHSLLVGHSPQYLPDFVLHGTSSHPEEFRSKLEHDLASTVKHSIIDEPIEHGVAIVADTDSWTCKLVTVSLQASDVIVSHGYMLPSPSVRQLLASVRGMWEMRLPSEFCLSHVEDSLLELNEQGVMLANTLLEYGSDSDIHEVLQKTMNAFSIRTGDYPLLLAIAGVHCSSDQDISAQINHTFMQKVLRRSH